MHGTDPYIAAVVALLFVAGVAVFFWALRERFTTHRNWDGRMVGIRGGENVRRSVRNRRA
jgi:hypothetical protein